MEIKSVTLNLNPYIYSAEKSSAAYLQQTSNDTISSEDSKKSKSFSVKNCLLVLFSPILIPLLLIAVAIVLPFLGFLKMIEYCLSCIAKKKKDISKTESKALLYETAGPVQKRPERFQNMEIEFVNANKLELAAQLQKQGDNPSIVLDLHHDLFIKRFPELKSLKHETIDNMKLLKVVLYTLFDCKKESLQDYVELEDDEAPFSFICCHSNNILASNERKHSMHVIHENRMKRHEKCVIDGKIYNFKVDTSLKDRLYETMRLQLHAAYENYHDVILIEPFGYSQGNPLELLADMYKKIICTEFSNCFKKVIFVLPDTTILSFKTYYNASSTITS